MQTLIKFWEFMKGKKSYTIAALTVIDVLIRLGLHQIDLNTAVFAILAAFGLSSLRGAVSNSK